MNRSTFLANLIFIFEHYDSFEKSVLNNQTDEISTFFEQKCTAQTDYVSDLIRFQHKLLKTRSTSEVLSQSIHLFEYFIFLEQTVQKKDIRHKIRLTKDVLMEDFLNAIERILDIEIQRFLHLFSKYSDLLNEELVIKICKNFYFEQSYYDYLLGYDLVDKQFEQISFLNLPKKTLDLTIGDRRIHLKRKIASEYRVSPISKEAIKQYQTIIKKELNDETYFSILEESEKKKPKREEKHDYQYKITFK